MKFNFLVRIIVFALVWFILYIAVIDKYVPETSGLYLSIMCVVFAAIIFSCIGYRVGYYFGKHEPKS